MRLVYFISFHTKSERSKKKWVAINVKNKKLLNVLPTCSRLLYLLFSDLLMLLTSRSTPDFNTWIASFSTSSIHHSSQRYPSSQKYTKYLIIKSTITNTKNIKNKIIKNSFFSSKNSGYRTKTQGKNTKIDNSGKGKNPRIIRYDNYRISKRKKKEVFVRKRKRKFRSGCRKGLYERKDWNQLSRIFERGKENKWKAKY